MPLQRRRRKDRQIVSLGDSCIERVCDRLDMLNLLTVRVAVLAYIASYIKRLIAWLQ